MEGVRLEATGVLLHPRRERLVEAEQQHAQSLLREPARLLDREQ
jgi:hypothetical protein